MKTTFFAANLLLLAATTASAGTPEDQSATTELPGSPLQEEVSKEPVEVDNEPMEGEPTREGMPVSPAQEEIEQEIESDLFRELDKDDNGMITKDEGARNRALAAQWDALDANADGQLDPSEFAKFEQNQP